MKILKRMCQAKRVKTGEVWEERGEKAMEKAQRKNTVAWTSNVRNP